MGDTIFATPAIRALRENYPQARIVVLATPAATAVLKWNPYNLEITTIIEKWDLFKILNQIRREGFDLAVSLSQLGGFFTRFCGTPHWSDFTLISVRPNRSVVQMCLEVLQLIGINSVSTKTEFWYSKQEQQIVDIFLQGSGYDKERPLIAIHGGGHFFIRKRWAVTNFIEIINFLMEETNCQVVLIGGSEDVEDSLLIKSGIPNIISAVGMLKLTETAALLKRSALFIGNDSGPLHLAAALDIPTIGLYGPTDPRQFYPYDPTRHLYIYKGLPCSPCYRFGGGIWQYLPRCTKAYCMAAITIDDLLVKLKEIVPERSEWKIRRLYDREKQGW